MNLKIKAWAHFIILLYRYSVFCCGHGIRSFWSIEKKYLQRLTRAVYSHGASPLVVFHTDILMFLGGGYPFYSTFGTVEQRCSDPPLGGVPHSGALLFGVPLRSVADCSFFYAFLVRSFLKIIIDSTLQVEFRNSAPWSRKGRLCFVCLTGSACDVAKLWTNNQIEIYNLKIHYELDSVTHHVSNHTIHYRTNSLPHQDQPNYLTNLQHPTYNFTNFTSLSTSSGLIWSTCRLSRVIKVNWRLPVK